MKMIIKIIDISSSIVVLLLIMFVLMLVFDMVFKFF